MCTGHPALYPLQNQAHDKSMGGEGTETETRPGGDEWPGW